MIRIKFKFPSSEQDYVQEVRLRRIRCDFINNIVSLDPDCKEIEITQFPDVFEDIIDRKLTKIDPDNKEEIDRYYHALLYYGSDLVDEFLEDLYYRIFTHTWEKIADKFHFERAFPTLEWEKYENILVPCANSAEKWSEFLDKHSDKIVWKYIYGSVTEDFARKYIEYLPRDWLSDQKRFSGEFYEIIFPLCNEYLFLNNSNVPESLLLEKASSFYDGISVYDGKSENFYRKCRLLHPNIKIQPSGIIDNEIVKKFGSKFASLLRKSIRKTYEKTDYV